MDQSNYKNLYKEFNKYFVGGVNSPVRAFRRVDLPQIIVREARGSKIIDITGRRYIDFISSWGAIILGHGDREVQKALKKSIESGTTYGLTNYNEVNLSRLILSAFPFLEKIRLVNSGTEATMTAVRLARAFTKKDIIIKFDGCYHGHSDAFLIKAGSGATTFGKPDSLGIPASTAKSTIGLPYNQPSALLRTVKKHKNKIAAIIIEPVACNMGVVPPKEEFMNTILAIRDKTDILLIFDEIVTGFRVCFGGFSTLYSIKPDLITLGKIIGGGLPIGALGGREEIMRNLSPTGAVYQAGTFSGNPLSCVAGAKTLEILKKNKDIYATLEQKAKDIENSIIKLSSKYNIPVQVNRFKSLFSFFFTKEKVVDYETALNGQNRIFKNFYRIMLKEGILLPPSPFEAIFLNKSHSDKDIEQTTKAIHKAFKQIA